MQSAFPAQLAVFLAVWFHAGPSTAQHARYRFATKSNNFESLLAHLHWMEVERGDVYLATKFTTGCSIGKFGGQMLRDGSQLLLFSMWDFSHVRGTAVGTSPWCTRFSQGQGTAWPAGTGSHCIIPYHFEVGEEYRFELTKSASTNGTLWSLTVNGEGSTPQLLIGSILVQQAWSKEDCSLLVPEAETFQEYFTGGVFYSSATWRGPFFVGNHVVAPVDVDADCGADVIDAALSSNVSSWQPGDPQRPHSVIFRRGVGVLDGCERPSLWQQVRREQGGCWQIALARLPGVAAGYLRTRTDYVRAPKTLTQEEYEERPLVLEDGAVREATDSLQEECSDEALDESSPNVARA